MIKVSIKKNGVLTHQSKFQTQVEADTWIAQQEALKSFGKPERWVHENDLSAFGEDKLQAIASELIGGMDEEMHRYKFAAEYVIEQEDITSQVEQEEINAEALKLLESTDWYVIRFLESGVPVPQNVSEARANARAAIVR